MRRGFSLVEAVVALTISTAVLLLVGSLFVAQGNFYDSLGRRAQAQDNVRAVAERLAVEIRSVMPGGFTLASEGRMGFRRPLALGVVCDRVGGESYVQLGMGEEIIDDAVGGFAWRDSTGVWQYRDRRWPDMFDGAGGAAAAACFDQGADTVGFSDTYYTLQGVDRPAPGGRLMIFAEMEYEVDLSALDDATLGLHRTVSDGDRVEFTSGLGAETEFGYRVGSTWQTEVAGGSLTDIEAVRVTVSSRIPAKTGGMEDAVVSWTVDIPLRNAS